MNAQVERLIAYPVKGLSPQPLNTAQLNVDGLLPDDRRFAIARRRGTGASSIDGWVQKRHFVTLVRDHRLAMLESIYHATEERLEIRRAGRPVAAGTITTSTGRDLIDQFLNAFLENEPGLSVGIVQAPDSVHFTDKQPAYLSIINLASVKDLERVTRAPVDPLRFRGNILVSGLPPWIERSWIGDTITVGSVQLKVAEQIGRCAATEVNPETGNRDMPITKALVRGYDHCECGVYARVVTAGTLSIGDPITVHS